MRDDFTLTRHLASVPRAKQDALSSPARWSEATRSGGGGPPERAQRVSGGGGGLRHCALGASMFCGDVGITQCVTFKLQVVQTTLDDITNADDPGELSIAQYRHVAHAMLRH